MVILVMSSLLGKNNRITDLRAAEAVAVGHLTVQVVAVVLRLEAKVG